MEEGHRMNLKEIRNGKGIEAKELAARLGLSPKTIWAYEEGRSEPNITNLIKMADILGCTVDELVRERKKMP